MTTTSNASKAGETTKEHLGGIEHLREQEVYHLTGLMKNCLSEAERLIDEIHGLASDRYTDFYGQKTGPLDFEAIAHKFEETDECVAVLLRYLDAVRSCNERLKTWTDPIYGDSSEEQAPYPVYMNPGAGDDR